MLIGEFARRIGTSADTIRFYEKVGFFSRARSDNGYRVYTDDDVETAELIASGKAMGFSLREIRAFLEEMERGVLDHGAAQRSLREKVRVIDARIAALEKARQLVEQQIRYCREAELSELTADR
jgi:MerR family transcriptional regulator, copper efflux regulator